MGSCTKSKPGKLNVPIDLGGASAQPGDIVVGNADGVVIVRKDRAEEVYQAACHRRQRELEIIEKLREGQTTVELLGLPSLDGERRILKK